MASKSCRSCIFHVAELHPLSPISSLLLPAALQCSPTALHSALSYHSSSYPNGWDRTAKPKRAEPLREWEWGCRSVQSTPLLLLGWWRQSWGWAKAWGSGPLCGTSARANPPPQFLGLHTEFPKSQRQPEPQGEGAPGTPKQSHTGDGME